MQNVDLMSTLAEVNPPLGTPPMPAELRDESAIEKLQRIDEQRPGFPGEHWLVLALGIGVWHYTRRNRHWAVRAGGAFAASVLVARAASGREGLAKVLRYTPLGSRISRCPPCETGS